MIKRILKFLRTIFSNKSKMETIQTDAPESVEVKKKYTYTYPGFPELCVLIKDNTKDRKTIADKHRVTVRYVDLILQGKRSGESKKAKMIIEDLTKLAQINKQAKARKREILAA